ncbi:acetyl-CoA synthetase-like protein [Phanerochaete sordida]|uniref:Acetyl-CoA synthetase-like protein n=1 Tax=Phanerochaete sordida TaxID=48140 RepID=A0A9P3GS54_9APHY|nr:acetyl-CoA synthetase-like protein [Phanerochaete sordida]
MDVPVVPPLDGSLLTIPEILDFHDKRNPDKPWFFYPSNDVPSEVASVTYGAMAEATHRIAHRVRPNREGADGQVVAILTHTDTVLYSALIIGIMRAGLTPYPMSPRNSSQGVCHMLETVGCTRIVGHAATAGLIREVQSEMQSKGIAVRFEEMPGFTEALSELARDARGVTIAPYPKSPEAVDVMKSALYIHSSGSTGFPKSVPFTYRRLLQWIQHNVFGGTNVRYGAMALPTFHAMGFMMQLVHPLATGTAVAVYTPQDPAPPVVAQPQTVYEVSKLCKCTAVLVPPSFIEAWSHSQEIVDYLKTLDVVIFGGGPLALATGNRLTEQGVRLLSGYGSTEIGNPSMVWDGYPRRSYPVDPDWMYFRAPSGARNVRWVPQGDGKHELIIIETDDYEIAMHNVPGERAFATSDLFEPHPTKPDLWRIVGRKDDVIILSTGEKIVPAHQEAYIIASPLVAGCVMFGREREQPGILVEPHLAHAIDRHDEVALAAFRNEIWARVEEANAAAPAFAKIFKEMILVTDLDKPLPRAAKSTVIRKQALEVYKDEIRQLYETITQSTNNEGIAPPRSWDVAGLELWLTEQAQSLVSHDKPIARGVDLFQQGFDSLSATFFRNRIIGALRSSDDLPVRQAAQQVSANLVFDHPTIAQLAAALLGIIDPSSAATASSPTDAVRTLIAKYTADIPVARAGKGVTRSEDDERVVLLTGSTGNIGSHILAYLLAEPRVARIYTLNRPSASAEPRAREKAAFRERGLPQDALDDPRLVSLAGEVTLDKFGLDDAQYAEVLGGVTHVIHNAWTVNFNLALQSFEDQIAGVRRLVDVAAASERPVQLLVTSSVSVANGWPASKGPVPEQLLPDPEVAAGQGYGSSKYVVEHILSAAREKGVHATAVRMGQACGPKATGAWGTTEWMPILTKTSVALGCLPALCGPVDWIPLDAVGEAYIDWALARDELPFVVNVVHPRPTTWEVVLRGLRAELGERFGVVPVQQWLAKLEEHAQDPSAEVLVQMPALKIIGFFRALANSSKSQDTSRAALSEGPFDLTFETAALLRSSPSMRAIQPMVEDNARAWVRFWSAKEFIVQL